MMNEDGGDDSGSGNGCCSWLWIKKKKSSRVQNPNTMVASSSEPHTVHNSEVGTMLIPIELLRMFTNNFSEENILGRGGSGTVYKGEHPNGITFAVKRMKPGAIVGGDASEFEAEMSVMRMARHKNLVDLVGYCLDGDEKYVVYEYMAQGTLSRYIFNWMNEGLQPLTWNQRLMIALDVARGVEYLHSLSRQSIIHRDLKLTNILLGNNMRAKVADFGLVCLARDENVSMEAKFAGTFGYIAPECAGTDRVTRYVDVFSFGVILMELITGRKALDESQPEDNMHIVPWFRRICLDMDSLDSVIDPTIDLNDETRDSIHTVAKLAGHCSVRNPDKRPHMGYVVKVLSTLVEEWRPSDSISEDGIDFDLSLLEKLKKWQADEGTSHWEESSSSLVPSLDNTRTSMPDHPYGFSGSSTSADEKMKGPAVDDASSSKFS